MKLWGVFLALALAFAFVAYIAYDPVPSECEATQMVHVTLGIMKLISRLCKFLGHFGVNEPVMYRKLISDFTHLSPIVPDPAVNVTDMVMSGVPVRLYQPLGKAGLSRGIVYFHGGGWTFGDLDMCEDMLVRVSKHLGAVIVSVDYALGPERPFPQAVLDSDAVTRHFFQKAKDFNVDTKRIGLMGDSAGATLATVISRRLRDSGFKEGVPKMQVMVYPVTQALNLNTPSYIGNKDGPFLTKLSMVMYIAVYLFGMDFNKYINDMAQNQHIWIEDPDLKPLLKFVDTNTLPDDKFRNMVNMQTTQGKKDIWEKVKSVVLDPDFSPLLVKNLSNLPHTYLSTCQYDVLRDDGFFYVHRLKEAGVKVQHDHGMNCYHGWIWHRNYVQAYDDMYEQMLIYMNKHL